MNKENKPFKLICPYGQRIQKMMESQNPGYCEKHCGKWNKDNIHFLARHQQQIECAHKFGIEDCRAG